ncbi:hypothetical protein KCMC57_up16500 [Kitasatospora sp. CMC57]|uniref:Uncharacterized protein n=2 Tax=Kitasatospora sp. CMC57 TaxID=3231513 RepID=A0AB33JY79_9ACTN
MAIQGILLAAVVAALPTLSSATNGHGGMITLSDAGATPAPTASSTLRPGQDDDGWP